MRVALLVVGLGVCAVGALGWAQVELSAPMRLAGLAVQPVPARLPTFWAPAGVRLEVQNLPGPKKKPKPPKAAPGRQKRGQANANKPPKVTICHRTDSSERPGKTITVSERAWKAHAGHGDTRGACPGQAPPWK